MSRTAPLALPEVPAWFRWFAAGSGADAGARMGAVDPNGPVFHDLGPLDVQR